MNIKVTLLDGTVLTTNVVDYNAQELADLVNVPEKVMVAIGDLVVNRHNIRTIIKSDTNEQIA